MNMDESLQWAAFQRLSKHLQRNCDAIVVIGPFNEHMLSPNGRERFRSTKSVVQNWLTEQDIPFISAQPLPSEVYGDASHPLTEGYELLAELILSHPNFQAWVINSGE